MKTILNLLLTLHALLLAYPNTAYSVDIKDSRGRTVSINTKPLRIASGTITSDEILWEILHSAKESSRIIALSTLADDPRYSNISEEAKKVTERLGTEVESTVKLKPDLTILASYNRPELLKRLEHVGIKTYVMGNFQSIADIKTHITNLGKLSYQDKHAKELLTKFNNELQKISLRSEALQNKSVISWLNDGSILGTNTLFESMIQHMHLKNIASTHNIKGWQKLSPEAIIKLDPDWIIASGNPQDKEKVIQQIGQSFAWRNLPAYKKKRIIIVPERELSSTTHHITKAMNRILDQMEAVDTP